MRQPGAHAYHGPRRPRFPPDIQRIIRRRRWAAWTAIAAFVAMLWFGGIGWGYEVSGSRAHGNFMVLVLVVWAAAVGLVGAGTFRLRRRGVFTVPFLDAPFSPVERRGPRPGKPDLPEWLIRALVGVVVLVILALTLSDQVNAVAYVTDSTSTAVFLPSSYIQNCGPHGCTTATAGTLESTGQAAVWPDPLPLGRAFTVRAPFWTVGSNPTLMTNGAAVWYTLLAMVIGAIVASALCGYVLRIGRRLRIRERPGWLVARLR